MYNFKYKRVKQKVLKKQMTSTANHLGQANPEQWSHHERGPGHYSHHIGHAVLNKIDQNLLVGKEQIELAETLAKDALAVTYSHLHTVNEQRIAKTGQPLPTTADGVREAYIAMAEKLQDKQITDQMTDEQLTHELMAKAILFSPQVSDALQTHFHHESKKILSMYNDVIGEIARSLPKHMTPGYKEAVVHALMTASQELNNKIGHSSEIAEQDPASGIDVIWSIMKGAQDEIAPENALQNDPEVKLIIPKDTESDLVGIDLMVERLTDGKTINIDMKSHGKYLSTVAKKEHIDWVDESIVGPYYYVGMHENGNPHFLLNASAFGEVPEDSFEYSAENQEKLRQTVHEMLSVEVDRERKA